MIVVTRMECGEIREEIESSENIHRSLSALARIDDGNTTYSLAELLRFALTEKADQNTIELLLQHFSVAVNVKFAGDTVTAQANAAIGWWNDDGYRDRRRFSSAY